MANYLFSLGKISHRALTVIRFTTTLKIFQRLCMIFPMLNGLKLALRFVILSRLRIFCKFSYGLCDRMQFAINCAKLHHCIISEALPLVTILCFDHSKGFEWFSSLLIRFHDGVIYYNHQNPSFVCFLMLIRAIVI